MSVCVCMCTRVPLYCRQKKNNNQNNALVIFGCMNSNENNMKTHTHWRGMYVCTLGEQTRQVRPFVRIVRYVCMSVCTYGRTYVRCCRKDQSSTTFDVLLCSKYVPASGRRYVRMYLPACTVCIGSHREERGGGEREGAPFGQSAPEWLLVEPTVLLKIVTWLVQQSNASGTIGVDDWRGRLAWTIGVRKNILQRKEAA